MAGTAGGYLGSNAFLTFIRNAENGVKEAGLFEGRGPLAIVLIVLLGGLALNLTPCVLPMIPPKPGAWMVHVKHAFGVIILATAAYYAYLGYELFDNRRVDASRVSSSVEEQINAGWYGSLAEGLGRDARAQTGPDRYVGNMVQELSDDG